MGEEKRGESWTSPSLIPRPKQEKGKGAGNETRSLPRRLLCRYSGSARVPLSSGVSEYMVSNNFWRGKMK